MWSNRWVVFFLLLSALVAFPMATSAAGATVYRHQGHHRRVVHRRSYIRHRTKWQHAKIIGGGAKTGASIGGMIGGPPGMAAGAAAGAGAGTVYDLKTRKVKSRRKVRTNS